MSAFFNEIFEIVNDSFVEGNSGENEMHGVFSDTVDLIGSNESHIEMHECITRVTYMTNIHGAKFPVIHGGVSTLLIGMIVRDIQMMNVVLHDHYGYGDHDSYSMININGNAFEINDVISKMFDSLLFLYLDDNDYDTLLNCDIRHGMNGDHGEDCKCVEIVLSTFKCAKEHAIDGRNSDDINSAVL